MIERGYRYFLKLDEALAAAKAQQDRYANAIMVLELPVNGGSLFFIIPHRDESKITEGILHYPTPKNEPVLPHFRRNKKKRIITNCPSCGIESTGLCPECTKKALARYTELAEMQSKGEL